jgi:hypothetical protein
MIGDRTLPKDCSGLHNPDGTITHADLDASCPGVKDVYVAPSACSTVRCSAGRTAGVDRAVPDGTVIV